MQSARTRANAPDDRVEGTHPLAVIRAMGPGVGGGWPERLPFPSRARAREAVTRPEGTDPLDAVIVVGSWGLQLH